MGSDELDDILADLLADLDKALDISKASVAIREARKAVLKAKKSYGEFVIRKG
jgi:hypothetical protein